MKKQKIKKIIVSIGLMIAILIVQVMQVAAVTNQAVTPSVICSSFPTLYEALIHANDGDVIGIDGSIIVNTSIESVLGDADKHITLVRMNEEAHIEINAGQKVTIQNITFDGNGIHGNQPMCIIYSKTELVDVKFMNCHTNAEGGAIQVYVGNVNMNRCTFKDNSARNGGHVALFNGSVLNMEKCSLINGHASEFGGAIYFDSSAAQFSEIKSSTIMENIGDVSGGGIYIKSGSLVVDLTSKLYKNTASTGEDMTVLITGNGSYTDSLDILNNLYADDKIKVLGWDWTEEPGTATKFYKLNFKEVIEPTPTPDPGETDPKPTEPLEPSPEPLPSEPGTGEGNTDNTEPSNPSKPTEPDENQSGNKDEGLSGGSSTTTDNSSHDVTTDNSDHSINTTDNSNHRNQNISNSGNTTTTNNSDNSRVESSDNHSSTTYNYYQNQQQPQVKTNATTEPIVINNYIEKPKEDSQMQQGEGTIKEINVNPGKGNNIKIDAKNVDVVFEEKNGVYTININEAKSNKTSSENINWYEVIKIVLLAMLVLNVLWKPRKKYLS